ncbi:hypothetical protein HGG82_08920 [Marinomonas sp. M1K-6]|uniref:Uncharacterized protein n=1 Tax=Marinomonas profundi TaxID=2726122 RepID=A0A847R6N1_9GAMM|nr:hypothetical protein [Marinomonas profundi]NLQ17746.1 hypothetical protein [Marinomonas profundi]UDV04303.1 hypothetical protein J8N69_06010 [Marinomonas profundi]
MLIIQKNQWGYKGAKHTLNRLARLASLVMLSILSAYVAERLGIIQAKKNNILQKPDNKLTNVSLG